MRRFAVPTVIVVALALFAGPASGAPHGVPPGSPPQQSDVIGGYASAPSVLPGGTLALHVSAPGDARYRVDIERLGSDEGPGRELVACLPACGADRPAAAQPPAPAPDASGLVAAGWAVTDTWAVPRDLAGGYYLAHFVVTAGAAAGAESWYPFVVRSPPGSRSRLLVIVPVNTWQAYNAWGGKSLYNFNSTGLSAAWRVSFDRPYGVNGADDIWWTEVQLVSFLQRAGYDTSYVTDVDVQRDPTLLGGHPLIIVGGHSEYWSTELRDGLEAARARGVNLAFLGANDGFWQIRYEDGERTLYRHVVASEPDGQPGTAMFRALPVPRPECQLEGVEFTGGVGGNDAHPYTVAADPTQVSWLDGTGLVPGATVPGMVGFEWDRAVPDCTVGEPGAPVDVQVILHYSDPDGHNADAVRYTDPRSGATVFAAGTLAYDTYLAGPRASAAIFRFTENMINELSAHPSAPLVAPTPARPAAPMPFLPAPAAGTQVAQRQSGGSRLAATRRSRAARRRRDRRRRASRPAVARRAPHAGRTAARRAPRSHRSRRAR